MELDHLDRRILEGLASRNARDRRCCRQFRVIVREGPGRVVSVAAGDFDFAPEVGHPVLDRLKGADRLAEGVAAEDEFAGNLERAFCSTNLLEGLERRCDVEKFRDSCGIGRVELLACSAVEAELRLTTTHVKRVEGGATNTFAIESDDVETDLAVLTRSDNGDIRVGAVGDGASSFR